MPHPLTSCLALTLVALVPVGCTAPSGSESELSTPSVAAADADVAVLFQADAAFAADVAERGLDAWLEWFTPDVVKLDMREPPRIGHAAVAESDGPLFADPKLRLTWVPDLALWLEPGRRGLTRGGWELARQGEDDTWSTAASGRYLSVWVLTEDGWKVELDAGVPDA